MSKIYLGKMVLHWCADCNLPVLGPTCACGNTTRKVDVTPPGDIRPAFPYDIDHINATAIERFGAPLIADGKIAILNKVPSGEIATRLKKELQERHIEVVGCIYFDADIFTSSIEGKIPVNGVAVQESKEVMNSILAKAGILTA